MRLKKAVLNYRITVLVVILFAGVLTGCCDPFAYNVLVQEEGTGRSISGATVDLTGVGTPMSEKTNDSGFARFSNIACEFDGKEGNITVSAEPRYKSSSVPVTISAGETQIIALKPDGIVFELRIEDDLSREPVPGVNVAVRAKAVDKGLSVDGETDNTGTTIILIPETLRDELGILTIGAEGYPPFTLEVDIPGTLPSLIKLKKTPPPPPPPEPDIMFELRVEDDSSGEPIPDASVTVRAKAADNGLSVDGETDDTGTTIILIPKTLRDELGILTIEAEGYPPFTLEVDIPGTLPSLTKLKKTPPPPPEPDIMFELRVEDDSSGEPIPGAGVTVRAKAADKGLSVDGETDDTGTTIILIPKTLRDELGILTIEAEGYPPFTLEVDIPGTLPSLIKLKKTPHPPPPGSLTIADFNSCGNINNLGGPMGAAYTTPNLLVESYLTVAGSDCIAKLEYNVEEWAGFWMKLQGENFTHYNKLTFDIRADDNLAIPEAIKVELKRPGGEIGILYISNIATGWQTKSVSFNDFGLTGYAPGLSSFTVMEELVFVFESTRSGQEGIVYIDNVVVVP